MRQFNSQTLWWSLILNLNKMLLGNCLRKCCWIVPKSMFLSCFLYKSLDFPESHCNVDMSFWPRLGLFDKGCFSLSRERALFTFSLIFSQNLTPVHLSIHTHIIMHTLSLSDFGQNNQRLKWLTLKIGQNDPPTKSETTQPLSLDATTQD